MLGNTILENSPLAIFLITLIPLTSTTCVMKPGISSVLASTRMICSPCSRASISISSFSWSRVSASRPINGFSMMSTFGAVNSDAASLNLRSSPLDSRMIYLSSSGSRWNSS